MGTRRVTSGDSSARRSWCPALAYGLVWSRIILVGLFNWWGALVGTPTHQFGGVGRGSSRALRAQPDTRSRAALPFSSEQSAIALFLFSRTTGTQGRAIWMLPWG